MPAPGPDPAGRDRPPETWPGDDRPSARVAMAASLLCRGHDPVRVAEITEVALAMVELIAEELADPATDTPTAMNTSILLGAARTGRVRRGDGTPPVRTRVMAELLPVALTGAVLLAVIVNLGLTISIIVWHLPALGLVSMLATAPLVAVLLLITIARAGSRPHPQPGCRWPRQQSPRGGDG